MIGYTKECFDKLTELLGKEEISELEMYSIPRIAWELSNGKEEITVFLGISVKVCDTYLNKWEKRGWIDITSSTERSVTISVNEDILKMKLADILGSCILSARLKEES